MKNSTAIVIGSLAALGIYLYSRGQSTTAPQSFEYMGKAATSIPIPPEYSGQPRRTLKEEQTEQTVLDTAARNNQSVKYVNSEGRTVGVQDANLGMSYRIEADTNKLKAASPRMSVQPISIVGTPYSTTNKTVAAAVNNPLAIAAAKLKTSTTSKSLKK